MRSLLFSLMLPVVCAAQAPVITVDQPHFDFGKIPAEGKAVHRFKVSNTGGGQLNISRLSPSCGCTSTVIGQWTLNPGQSTEVEATFNPSGFRGMVHKSIQVVCNDPATPTVNLTFEAEVIREITATPSDSLFFQDVYRSAPRKMSVKFVSSTGQPVHLTEAKAASPWLSTAIRTEGKDAWVDVVLDGAKVPPERMLGTDAIAVHTDNPRVPYVNLTVQWEFHATITVEPGRVAWVEEAGKQQRQKLTLKQVDGKPFRILSVKTTNPVVTVEGTSKAAAVQHDLQVVLAAKAKVGMYNEKILVTTDSPDQPELEIRVAASLR